MDLFADLPPPGKIATLCTTEAIQEKIIVFCSDLIELPSHQFQSVNRFLDALSCSKTKTRGKYLRQHTRDTKNTLNSNKLQK